jgi:hypothetical protein
MPPQTVFGRQRSAGRWRFVVTLVVGWHGAKR